jgi:KDO2-lipid IV(A) lauroyltransferase
MSNLRNSFPEKKEPEILRLSHSYYHNLCDITLETVKGLSLSKPEIERRFSLSNLDILLPHLEKGQSLILLGSHLTNWEWGSLAIAPQVEVPVFGIYKRLANETVEAYLNQKRSRFGLRLVPMENTARTLVRNRRTPSLYCLIADQTPSNRKRAHWANFLHQETPFLRGADQLARMSGFPVYYYDTRRVGRGFYEVTFSPLILDPTQCEEGEITLAYVRKLESIIQEEPADWLWSHRRWKFRRPEGVPLLRDTAPPPKDG